MSTSHDVSKELGGDSMAWIWWFEGNFTSMEKNSFMVIWNVMWWWGLRKWKWHQTFENKNNLLIIWKHKFLLECHTKYYMESIPYDDAVIWFILVLNILHNIVNEKNWICYFRHKWWCTSKGRWLEFIYGGGIQSLACYMVVYGNEVTTKYEEL